MTPKPTNPQDTAHSESELSVEEIIQKAVDRFLGWELPDFYPDGGITFNRIPNHKATGTNLFSAQEAKEMFEYALSDTLSTLSQQTEARVRGEIRKAIKEYEGNNCNTPSRAESWGNNGFSSVVDEILDLQTLKKDDE